MFNVQRRATLMEDGTVNLDIYATSPETKMVNHEKYSIHDGKYLLDRSTKDNHSLLYRSHMRTDTVMTYSNTIKNGFTYETTISDNKTQYSSDGKDVDAEYNSGGNKTIRIVDKDGNLVMKKYYHITNGKNMHEFYTSYTYDECSRLIYRKTIALTCENMRGMCEEIHSYKTFFNKHIHIIRFYNDGKFVGKTIVKKYYDDDNKVYMVKITDYTKGSKKVTTKICIDDSNHQFTSITLSKKKDPNDYTLDYHESNLYSLKDYINEHILDRLDIVDHKVCEQLYSLTDYNSVVINYSDKRRRIPSDILVYDLNNDKCMSKYHILFDNNGMPTSAICNGNHIEYDMIDINRSNNEE